MIRCRFLGPVEVAIGDGPAPATLLWRKNIALLAYLALSPRRGRTREHLVGLLWPEREESKAKHSLNQALSDLRGVLGDGAIQSDAGQIRLAPDTVELDVEQLDSLAGTGSWTEAARLVVGEFMEGFGVPDAVDFENWLTAERQRWRARGVEVLTRAGNLALESGDASGAAELAGRARGLEPAAEAALRLRMRALTLSGHRLEALTEFDRFVAWLKEYASTAPEADTLALAERIRRGKSWRLGSEPERTVPGQSRRQPLLGRAVELGRILDAWKACREERRCTLVVIEGDSGSGKSRLLEELLDRARLDLAVVTGTRTVEADTDEPFGTVFGLARGGLLEAPGLPGAPVDALATFVARFPEWADRFSRVPVSPQRPPLAALSELLHAALADQPVLLAVDDAQWADRDSLLALGVLLRDHGESPLLVCLNTTGTPARAEIDGVRVRVGREIRGTVVHLGSLPMEAIRSIARRILPQFTDTELDRVTRRVAMDSAGLPLLVIELLNAVALGYDLGSSKASWPQPFHTLTDTMPGDLPDAIVAAFRIGFRRLSPDAQAVLIVASVLEERVSVTRLGSGAGLADRELQQALDELEWQRWLVADPRGYSFVARIARDVIARDMVTSGQKARIIAAADPAGDN
jgi:DNA-binding SARP family transcriptional activator